MTAVLSSRSGVNPYVGPRPFERDHGRDREVARLRDLLIAERIVLLYSPSGAGKTSLIRAGLAPDLEREGFRVSPKIRVAGAGLASGDRAVNRCLMSTLICLEKRLPPQAQRDPAELAGIGLTVTSACVNPNSGLTDLGAVGLNNAVSSLRFGC